MQYDIVDHLRHLMSTYTYLFVFTSNTSFSINLAGNGMGPTVGLALGKALVDNTYTEVLSLGKNELGKKGWKSVSPCKFSND